MINMPPAYQRTRLGHDPRDTNANESDRSEIMAGVLDLQRGTTVEDVNSNPDRPQRVFVRIYRTSVDHFAVLYPVRALVTACGPLATVNLKSCRVERVPDRPSRFRVSPRGAALALFFEIPLKDIDSIDKWLSAWTTDAVDEAVLACTGRRGYPKKPLLKSTTIGRLLPVLDEEEEQCI